MIFYAVSAGIAALVAAVFFVAVFRRKRVRRAGDVLFFVFGSVFLFVGLIVGAFAVIRAYPSVFKLSVAESGTGKFTALVVSLADKRLFSVPYIGKAVSIFASLGLSGVVVPFALFALLLIAVITLGVKTYRKKKKATERAEILMPVSAAETDGAAEESDERPSEVVAPAESESGTVIDELPLFEEDDESAHDIVNEIDKLVTGEQNEPQNGDIDDALRRAIKEGYALFDAYGDPANIDEYAQGDAQESDGQEKNQTEEEQQSSFAPKEDSLPDEEENNGQESDEVWAFEAEHAEENDSGEEWDAEANAEASEESEVESAEAEILHGYVAERRHKQTVSVEETEEVPEEPRKRVRPVSVSSDREIPLPTRVRTIVRRPTAKNIADIEKRAEEILEESEGQAPAANGNKSDTAQKNGTEKVRAARQQTPAQKKEPPRADKVVVAEESGLPLTRKYIILNRRNAAAIFNDYLNSKRDVEKEELKGSLNTIIIK